MPQVKVHFRNDGSSTSKPYYAIESIITTEDEYILVQESGTKKTIPKDSVRELEVPPEVNFDR